MITPFSVPHDPGVVISQFFVGSSAEQIHIEAVQSYNILIGELPFEDSPSNLECSSA